MRIVLAFLVMGWVVNLIFAFMSGDRLSIGFALLYLAACAYGLFVRGPLAGLVALVAIGIGVEALFLFAADTNAPAVTLLVVLLCSGLAILAGNLFRSD